MVQSGIKHIVQDRNGLFVAVTQAPPPRLKPNLYARLVRRCWRNAYLVIIFWVLLASLATAVAVWKFQKPNNIALAFPTTASKESAGAEAFAKLSRLQVATLSHPDAHELNLARDSIVADISQHTDLFAAVVAPSVGIYYDDHNLLYRPLAEVQARVAYALSLKPLFEAVSVAPDSGSMATLLSGIAGTVSQGNDPQGLDDMMAEGAAAVQALALREDHALDWAKIADLEYESPASKAIVNILPVEGREIDAATYLANLAKAAGVELQISGTSAPAEIKSAADISPPTDKTRLLAALLMGAVFAALLTAIVMGRAVIATVAAAPTLMMVPISFLSIILLGHSSWLSLWPIAALGILVTATVSLGLILEAAHLSPQLANDETAIMLAAHDNGSRLLWRGLLPTAPFVGLALLPQPAGYSLALAIVALALVGLLVSFTLPPALSSLLEGALDWRAAKWWAPAHRSLFETGQWQVLSHGLGVLVVLAGLLTTMSSIRKPEPIEQASVSVAVLAQSDAEAESLIAKLREVPSAAAVQWLGSFLPEQTPEKLAQLQRLQGQFPHIEPVGWNNAQDVRDVVEAMQDSLRQVALASNARPSLKQSADAFRQSLAVLAATSDDKKLRELNNKLFGAFNRLAERAETLATLKSPMIQDLPAELQTLFGAPPGPYRLVVTPVAGVPPGQLAETLDKLGFPVLHPAVVAAKAEAARYTSLTRLLLSASVLIIVLSAIAIGEVAGFGISLVVGFATTIALAGTVSLWHQGWTLQWLLAICLLSGWLASCLLAAAPQNRATLISAVNVFLVPGLLLVAAVPLALLGLDSLSQQILPLAIAMVVVSTTIGLFQRHGPVEEF